MICQSVPRSASWTPTTGRLDGAANDGRHAHRRLAFNLTQEIYTFVLQT